MKLEKIKEHIKDKYLKRFPEDRFYTDLDIRQTGYDLPLAVFCVRGLALDRITAELYFTTAVFESNRDDDIIPPRVDISGNTIRICREDIKYITKNALYASQGGNIND